MRIRFPFKSLFLLWAVLALWTSPLLMSDLLANDLTAEPRSLQTRAHTVFGSDEGTPPGTVVFSNSRWPYSFDNWQLGTTWWDSQQSGSQGKQIAVSEDGVVHFCWMMGYDNGAATRHTVYGCFLDGDISGPVPADNTSRSGYCALDVLDANHAHANAAVVAFHQGAGMGGLTTTISPDWGSCWLSFVPFDHPAGDDPPIAPLMAIDINNKVHFLANPMYDNAPRYDATVDFSTWETPDWVVMPTSSFGFSAVPVTSEFDGRVALLTHDHIDVHPDDEGLIFSQTINDVWAYISLDGDFTDLLEVSSINITDLLDAETTEHPLPGHVYAYCDIDGVFDSDGNLHVVYTTTPYWPDYTLLDGEAADPDYFERWSWTGQVWHAMISAVDEEIDITHVAGYVGSNNEDDQAFASYFDSNPGSWNTFNDRPSLAIDPASNTLYCMWRSFTNLPDTSAIGYANADLFVRSSCDYGATWGPAVNITDSFTPECETGDCASEAWGTLAESVYDGLLHLEFVEDLDAGAGTLGEGEWTESPVWYLQVPVVDVPCGNAWNAGAHATQLVDTEWNWGALSDGTYEIVDFMHLLNEGAGTLTLQSIELLYDDILPDISIDQINGNLGDNIAPYQTAVFEYTWNAVIADDEQDAIIRFHTSGGTVDFKLANRNPLDFGTAQSFTWWEDVNPQSAAIPVTVSLAQNYPNPFNPTTTIEYSLSAPATVQLAIFNLLGEQVAILTEGLQAVGNHSVTFDGGDLTSGIYLYRLTSGEQNLTRKMVLVK